MKCLVHLFCVTVLLSAGVVRAESVSFSTDFSGTTLDSRLTAAGPSGTLQALDGNGHLKLFTSPDGVPRNADIWETSNMNGVRVTYAVDSTDTRDFALQTVISSWTQTGTGDQSQTGILLTTTGGDTVLFGLWNSTVAVQSPSGHNAAQSVDNQYIIGDSIDVGLKVVRSESTNYALYYRLGDTAAWQMLTTFTMSDGITSVGLYCKTWGGASISNATFDSMSFAVPEPTTTGMVLIGVGGLLAYAWRKRQK